MSEQDKIRANRDIAYSVVFMSAEFANIGWLANHYKNLDSIEITLSFVAAVILLCLFVACFVNISKTLRK